MDKPKTWILKKRIIAGVAFLITAFVITHQTQLLECASDSLKGVRYILVLKGAGFKRGDLVAIKGHSVAYTPQTHFAKRVLGLSGDQIIHHNDTIRVGTYALPLLTQTQEGKPLTPLSGASVPPGHVFVAGDHPRSFDSRYEEFGLVPLSKVWGKGIFTW